MYKISKYSKDQALKLGVDIKASTCKNKKIDVYKDGIKLCSIGDVRYKDYGVYLTEDKTLAEERRRLYKLRHKSDANVIGSAGYYSSNILW